MNVSRIERGQYLIRVDDQEWKIWRGVNGRWYGESKQVPGKMIDDRSLRDAKLSLKYRQFVNCASAGL